MGARVNLYFLASPLQTLAALRIARTYEHGAINIALPYKPGARESVNPNEWDRVDYVPWPRFEPMPGLFGKVKRTLNNLQRVKKLIPEGAEICMHTAVLDTEAINYYVNFLRSAFVDYRLTVRILPDGLISTRRYPLSRLKRGAQCIKKMRRFVTPSLNYYCYSGDRCGSDASVVDRIYVLSGFPHEYREEKVVELPALVNGEGHRTGAKEKRALVIGQPLVGAGLLPADELTPLTVEIAQWLDEQGAQKIYYKVHPKDPNAELCTDGYETVQTPKALEEWLVTQHFDWVVGGRSTALLTARQLCGSACDVRAFGFDRLLFKSDSERRSITQTFMQAGVSLHGDEV